MKGKAQNLSLALFIGIYLETGLSVAHVEACSLQGRVRGLASNWRMAFLKLEKSIYEIFLISCVFQTGKLPFKPQKIRYTKSFQNNACFPAVFVA